MRLHNRVYSNFSLLSLLRSLSLSPASFPDAAGFCRVESAWRSLLCRSSRLLVSVYSLLLSQLNSAPSSFAGRDRLPKLMPSESTKLVCFASIDETHNFIKQNTWRLLLRSFAYLLGWRRSCAMACSMETMTKLLAEHLAGGCQLCVGSTRRFRLSRSLALSLSRFLSPLTPTKTRFQLLLLTLSPSRVVLIGRLPNRVLAKLSKSSSSSSSLTAILILKLYCCSLRSDSI